MLTLARLALRNVLRNRRRTLITLAALSVGVGATVTVRSLLTGVQQALLNGLIDGTTGALQVHRAGYLENVLSTPLTLDFPADDALMRKVREVKGVKAVAPRLQFAGSLQVGEESLFFSAQAVDPVQELRVTPKRSQLFGIGARFDEQSVLLGSSLSRAVNAKVGEEAVLLAPDRDGALNAELTQVGGELGSIMPGEPMVALVPFTLAQRLLRMEGRATELAVAIDSQARTEQIAAELRQALGPTFEVSTWEDLLGDRKVALERQKILVGVVSAVFLLLMLLGIANATLMSVLERTREIGTMMAVGLKRGQVLVLILLEATLIGALGAVGGLLLGGGITLLLGARGFSVTPPQASLAIEVHPTLALGHVVSVMVIAVVGAALFSLYPAWRAGRLRPIDALAGR